LILWPTYATNWNGLNNFGSGTPRHHYCEVWSKSNERFQRRSCLKKLLTDGRTDWQTMNDGQWVKCILPYSEGYAVDNIFELQWKENRIIILTSEKCDHNNNALTRVYALYCANWPVLRCREYRAALALHRSLPAADTSPLKQTSNIQ